MASRRIMVTPHGGNEVKLSGATAVVAREIKELAKAYGLNYKFDDVNKVWLVSGGKVNEFISDLQKEVKGKVEVVIDLTKKPEGEHERKLTFRELLKLFGIINEMHAAISSAILKQPELTGKDAEELISSIKSNCEEIMKLLGSSHASEGSR